MDLQGSALVIVADGAQARLFEERVRGGPLNDISHRLGVLSSEHPRASHHSGRVFDRFGTGSHTTGRESPKVREEADFVRRVAERAEAIMRDDDFDTAVLIAAPRALGGLRAAFSKTMSRKVVASQAADRCAATPEEIRAALREIRLSAA